MCRHGFAGAKWIMNLAALPHQRRVFAPSLRISHECLQFSFLVSELFKSKDGEESVYFTTSQKSRCEPPSRFGSAVVFREVFMISPGLITETLIFNHHPLRETLCLCCSTIYSIL